MSITGAIFLFAFIVIGFVILKFAVKVATYLVALIVGFGILCWWHPPLYELIKPIISRVTPFVLDGASEAAATAKEISEKSAAGQVNKY